MSTAKKQSAKTSKTVDLFAAAVKKPEKKSASKDDKEVILVDDERVAKALAEYEEGKKMEEAGAAKKAEAESIIKPHGKETWLAKYLKEGKRPESFILSNKFGNSMMYIVMDAYKKIDEERKDYLAENYGEDVVETENEYVINPEMIQKYGKAISEAIMKSKDIPTDDKMQIIQVKQKFSVKKGLIDKLKDVAANAKTTIQTIFEEVVPTQQLKPRGSK